MFSQLCQRIRLLTIQADELVDHKEIEQCLKLLGERQTLLDQLKLQFLASEGNADLSSRFTAL